MLEEAAWIGLPWPDDGERPAPVLRRRFDLGQPVGGAVLQATALGVVVARLDDVEVDLGRLVPGWSEYAAHVRVREVELGELSAGEHVLELELGEGWWSGHTGYHRVRSRYGDRLWARARLAGHVAAGERPWAVATGPDWEGRFGRVRANDLHDGEHVDLRTPRDALGPWRPVEVGTPAHGPLVPDRAPPIRVVERVPAVAVAEVLPGVQVVDFGRNLAGHVEIDVTTAEDRVVALRHGEWLEEDGTLYRANLREARQTDRYELPPGRHVVAPTFTTHGFRYAEVTGAPLLDADEVTACVVRTDLERVGWFACSDERIDRLHQLAVWSIESNSIGLPTDCPQRDERLGWLEDVAALVPTRAYLFDHLAFLRQWLDDVRAAQGEDGWFPDVAPLAGSDANPLVEGAPGWADAGVQVPWLLHRWYGDEDVVRENLAAATRFVRAVQAANPDGRWQQRRGADYGDWLGWLPASKDLVAQAHAVRTAACLADLARLAGDDDVAAWAHDWRRRTNEVFLADHVDDEGHVGNRTISAATFALAFDLLPDRRLRDVALTDLVASAREHGNAVTCGYLALPHVLHVLSDHGRDDVAWDLLLGEQVPGWMHLVDAGATSLWERWDSWTPETGLHQAWLNSLNHASLGVVADWLHARVGGLAPAAPGWDRVRVAPRPGGGVTWASTRHRCRHGEVAVEWERRGTAVEVRVQLPAGVTADVVDPAGTTEILQGPIDTVCRWT